METISTDLHKLNKLFDEMAESVTASDADIYNCTICRDSGIVVKDGTTLRCECQRSFHISALKQAAGLTKRLQRMRFESFDLGYYSDQLRTEEGSTHQAKAEQALRNARKFAASCIGGNMERGLMLQGDVGCGKTHLAAAIANELTENGIEVLFLVVPEFLDQLRGSYRRENEGLDEIEIIKQAYEVPVLILDDLGAHNFTDWVSNKLFTIINHRYNRNLPCIITTNLTTEEMDEKIGSRTTSRILEACARNSLFIDRDLRIQQRPGRRV